MDRFRTTDGIELAYDEVGAPDGPPVVLLHGFAASTKANWEQPGVTVALAEAGYRALGLDARGHGRSDKPHDPSSYPKLSMVRDVSALFDHLQLESAAVVGYSMGSLTTAVLLPLEPRARLGVLGGVGHRMLRGRRAAETDAIAAALEADDAAAAGDPTSRAFRAFAEGTGADRLALAATQRAGLHGDPIDVSTISVPVLVITGEADTLVGDPHRLAQEIPGGRAAVVTGDHLGAVNDPAFAAGIVAFLDEHTA
jgi:pimeloyl-ACP methyl ester carboxylesterase